MKYFLCAFFFFTVYSAISQNRNSVWCFGDSVLVDFTNVINPTLGTSGLNTRGSSVSISDSAGSLLFSAETRAGLPGNTTQVFNSMHVLMSNGDSIVGQGWYNYPQYFITQAQQLYAVEKKIRDEQLSAESILTLRNEKALPILKAMEVWLKDHIIQTTPTSPIGKAISYSLSRWERLSAYVYDPILEIDNNLVENAIRPTVIGRKNYMFAGSHDGARRSAMIYSFFGSCKMNNINPQEWLADVLFKISDTKQSQLYTLLPNFWKKS